MKIDEIVERKKKLEADITTEINRLLLRFHMDTKLTPSRISIYLEDVTTINDRMKYYIVSKSEAEIVL